MMQKSGIFLAVAFATASTAHAANTIIVDGDTIEIGTKTIRIVEIDAPESYQPRCEQELVQALAAKERLRALLDAGKVSYKATGKDRYGRTLAHVFAGGVNVGQTLIAEGYALLYQPGPEAKLERLRAWCGPTAQLDDTWGGSAPINLVASKSKKQQQQQDEYSGPFPNCKAARAAGAAPVYRGDPGYQPKLDRDGDGIGCE